MNIFLGVFFSILSLGCASILCYFAYENITRNGWIRFLDEKIENIFLCFMAKFWITALLLIGFFAFLIVALFKFNI